MSKSHSKLGLVGKVADPFTPVRLFYISGRSFCVREEEIFIKKSAYKTSQSDIY